MAAGAAMGNGVFGRKYCPGCGAWRIAPVMREAAAAGAAQPEGGTLSVKPRAAGTRRRSCPEAQPRHWLLLT